MEFKNIRILCESLWKEDFEEFFQFHITTNGTLIHGEQQNWLRLHKNEVIVKLSLDGDEYSNNLNRPQSYNHIDIPFFVNTWPDIRVNMTVTPKTISRIDINVKHLHELGFKYIFVNFAMLTNWGNCNQEKVFYEKLMNLAYYYLEHKEIIPINLFQFDISRTINKNNIFFAPCNIGTKSAYDLETKKYYPCHMFFPSVCGKQIGDKLSKIDFTKRNDLISNCCKACPFLNICRTCYADNFICRGSLCKRDMSLCIYQKIIFTVLFKYEYAKLTSKVSLTEHDYEKMEAIYQWSDYINKIETSLAI